MISKRQFLFGMAALPLTARLGAAHTRQGDAQQSGGFVLPEHLQPQYVQMDQNYAPGQIIVSPREHYLYYVTEPGMAVRYGVGVGRAGLEFQGTAVVERKEEWPSWRPTDEMIEREPDKYAQFADGVPGGPENPLGARALYLYKNGRDTYYRIHGTTQPESIGRSVSNGCIRMLNEHVMDLYERVPLGTPVFVL